ncbi:MAG: SUMF1/EgtB/PvdO family nonheme iron enzyme [Candidatus Aminicenantes bacterium]|nr:SUMF1/EgtB/PvdO family nonheme iron enzyme [Candidatus Aminicenantes bacterium]
MTNLKNYPLTKFVSFMLVMLLFLGNLNLSSQNAKQEKFSQALKFYNQRNYEEATSFLEEVESLLGTEEFIFKAKIYILFCACYEKMGKENLARAFSAKIQRMLDRGQIEELPEINGFDLNTIQIIKRDLMETEEKTDPLLDEEEEIDEYHFKFKEPEPVKPVDRKAVIQYQGRKEKRKKFPWIAVIVGVVIVGVVIYFLLNKKDQDDIDIEAPEIEWVYVPAGEFLMGDNFNEGDSDETPVHKVYLGDYYISKYEISVSQYDQFCMDTDRQTLFTKYYLKTYQLDYAAIYVSWEEASAYCQWLSQKTGENIHLPTEAQWERAARGTNQNRYPWGNSPPNCNLVNFLNCGFGVSNVYNLGAGATPSGIYQMAGNVWEWCQDYYSPTYYSQSPYQNPQGPTNGVYRVMRGGSITSQASDIRSANRRPKDPDEDNYDNGFRIVKED